MTESLAKEQAKIKPALEEIIKSELNSTKQKDVLAFLDYCKSRKVSYHWSSTNRWNMKAKGKSIGYIDIGGERKGNNEGSWYLDLDLRELHQYDEILEKENLSGLVCKYLKQCFVCGSCSPGSTVTFFGKEFKNVCHGLIAYVNDPDAGTMTDVQKLIDIRLAIPQGTANRPIKTPEVEGLQQIDNKLQVINITDLQGVSNENITLLFDGKYDKYYYIGPYGPFKTDKNSHDVVFELHEPETIKMYSLVTSKRPDAPPGWTFYGAASRDGPWLTLDRQDEFPKPVTSYTEKAFEITAPGLYKYYRITFEGRWFMISQLHLYG